MISACTNNYSSYSLLLNTQAERVLIGGLLIPKYPSSVELIGALGSRKKIAYEAHISDETINSLKTRKETIKWIEKFQYLTDPNAMKDRVTPNTVGAGFVSALYLADAGTKLGLVSESPTRAVVSTIAELKKLGKLEVFNKQDFSHFYDSQIVETKEHMDLMQRIDRINSEDNNSLNKEEGYGIVGKALTYAGPNIRAVICKLFSSELMMDVARAPTDLLTRIDLLRSQTIGTENSFQPQISM